MSTQASREMDAEEKIAQLKDAARERWGERWTVEVRHFADGDTHAMAYQSRGSTNEGYLEQHRMVLTEDKTIAVTRVVREDREIKEELIDEFEFSMGDAG